MFRFIGYIRGLFAEIIVLQFFPEFVTVAINGTLAKHNYTKESFEDLKTQNNVNITYEFATVASENFYKSSGILVSPYRISLAVDKFLKGEK